MTNGTEVVSLQGLTHSYGAAPVLTGIDLTIYAGEFVGLIGLSGSGKSTLLRCVNGLLTPTGGTCIVLGQPINLMPDGERRLLRRRIGMIFQEFNLVDRLTVLKNVLIGRLGYSSPFTTSLHIFSRSDRDLALSCLADVGLDGVESRRVRDLSGGQKQRVAIARAMAQGADLVLADEATANLDVLTKYDIMDLLQALVETKKMTILASMHDVPLARQYCSRIIGLKGGRITFDAPPESLDDAAVADVMGRAAREPRLVERRA